MRVKRFSSKAATFFSPFEPCWTNDVAAHQVEPPSAFGCCFHYFPLTWDYVWSPTVQQRRLFWREQKLRHQRTGARNPSQSDGAPPRAEDFHVRDEQLWAGDWSRCDGSSMFLHDLYFKFHPTRQTMLRQFEVGWKWLDWQRWVEFCLSKGQMM